MRHAEDDVLDPQGAAALNNLLERRNHGFAAVETKTLRARVLYGEELLESFRLDKLVEHRALAFLGERNFLSGAFDPPLQPSLFSRIGDMHEFEPDGAAIGAAQDLQHFGNGRELKPKHSINENFPVVVGLREAIGGRMQLLVVFWGLDAKRIEVGMEMTAYAIGTDHHQRAHRITGRALEFAGGQRSALAGFRLEFGADPRFGFRPIAVERRNEFAAGGGGPAGPLPVGPLRSLRDRGAFVVNLREEFAPGGVERGGIANIAILELLDISGVAAIKKRRPRECGIGSRAAARPAARTIGISIRVPARHRHLLRAKILKPQSFEPQSFEPQSFEPKSWAQVL